MQFCDLECKYAEFPKDDAVDGSRSCRTFIALYCRKKKFLVHKNAPCKEKEVAAPSKPATKKSARKKS